MITAAQIKKFAPGAKPALVNAIVANWPLAVAAGISTDLRTQYFMTQIATETGGLKAVEESLNYSVTGLLKTFGRHRISEGKARELGRTSRRKADQEAIANTVYGGAWGLKNLGNTEHGDGWKYRGGGMMQTTGRENYRNMGFEANPEALRDPVIAFKTAVREWAKRGCNALADKDNVAAVRKAINGGSNGLADAKAYLKKAKTIFISGAQKPASKPKDVSVAVPIEVPIPTPKPVTVSQEDVIRQVQDLLWDKGYPEVGESDGKLGKRTRNAILAFQADNDLPLTGQVTDELLAQLIKAPKREMAPAREKATEKDLKAEPVVENANWLKRLGAGILAASGLGGILDGNGSLEDAANGVGYLRTITETVLPILPWLLVGAAGIGVFYFGRRVVQKHVEAYREGRAF